jgi:hypothetical protein
LEEKQNHREGGIHQVHRRELVPRGDALIERREDAEPQLTRER